MHHLHPQVIRAFKSTFTHEIAEVSTALSGKLDIATAGMWVSLRQNRLAEYQQAIEDINETINHLRDLGINWSRAHRDMFRARQDLYRAVADELGAYPQRQASPSQRGMAVTYVIESEDKDQLT
jgi:hypothetical protein